MFGAIGGAAKAVGAFIKAKLLALKALLVAKKAIFLFLPIIIAAIATMFILERLVDFRSNILIRASGEVGNIIRGTGEFDGFIGAYLDEYGIIRINPEIYDKIESHLADGILGCALLGENRELLQKMVRAEVVTSFPYTGVYDEEDDMPIQGSVIIYREGIGQLEFEPYEDFRTRARYTTQDNFAEIQRRFTVDRAMNIVIATYSIEARSVETNAEELEETNEDEGPVGFQLQLVSLQYERHVMNYAMPFEFLYVLLRVTRDVPYVTEVANLAIEHTRIVYTVADSRSVHTTIRDNRHYVDEGVAYHACGIQPTEADISEDSWQSREVYNITTTTIETNNIRGQVTSVRTWIVERERTSVHTSGDAVENVGETILDGEYAEGLQWGERTCNVPQESEEDDEEVDEQEIDDEDEEDDEIEEEEMPLCQTRVSQVRYRRTTVTTIDVRDSWEFPIYGEDRINPDMF
ncbi:MAG: hypothetical protein FWC68_04395, partial [Oscillospiraceae bacterium]|nr:hypothetical protein [Oscillospiraceae bacterium]